MSLTVLIVASVLIVNIILSFSLIFIERREPSTTWAWLLIMTIFPGMGFVCYLLLGQNFSRERLFKDKILTDIQKRREISKKWVKEKNTGHHGEDRYFDLRKMNYNHSGAKYTRENDVKIFFDGKKKFESLIYDIEHAEKFIHIQYYIIRRDNIGEKIIKILEKKAKEGVQVRFLVDSMGSYTITKRSLKEFIKDGGKFEIFFPGILPHINTRINYRNHRKMVIIDGVYGYIGGFNVGDEYIGLNKKIGYWRDTHIRIKGTAVNALTNRFLLDWCYASGEDIENFSDYYLEKPFDAGDVGIQIISSGPDHNEEYIKNSYIKMINNAKKNIYLETPYFVPDESVVESLKISALSGVDVKLMVPNKPDHIFMQWAANSYFAELLKSGVKIYTYNNGFIHAKTIVADTEVCSIGTANMDIRSFRLNFEVNALIFDNRVARIMEKQFNKDMEECNMLKLEEFKNRGKRKKMLESLTRLVAPIL